MVTLYIDPELYERVRCAAYALDENIYQFVGEAFTSAVVRRLDRAQRDAVNVMARQNVANGTKSAKGGKRRSKHNPAL